jgi:hypothetical protein
MKALVLQMSDGASHVAFIDDAKLDLDAWIEERYDGLLLLGVIRVELRDKIDRIVRRIAYR